MKDCNYSIYLAGQSIDKIDAVNKGYQKAIEEMSKIIHSKDNLDFWMRTIWEILFFNYVNILR